MEKREFGRGTELSAKSFSGGRQFVVVVGSSTPFSEGGSAKLFMGTTKPPDSDANNGAVAETVALKFFVANLASYQEQMIRRELRAAQKVAHRYILPYIGTTTFHLSMILISPYMRNGNLLQYLAGDPMRDWRPMVFQVATAVEFLHSDCKMVHGDLKCENVLVSNDGQALLSDFGLCTCIDKTEKHTATATELRGQNTFRYAAPELLFGSGDGDQPERKTVETDVYAFGMTIIQACTRQHPWPECTHNRVLMKIDKREEHPRPSGTYARDFSDLWWELVLACCSYDPAARPTMSSALSKLASFGPVGQPLTHNYRAHRGNAPAGLRTGEVIAAEQVGSHNILSIRVVSGVVASGGNAYILKGEVQSPRQPGEQPTVVAIKVIPVQGADVEQVRFGRALNAVQLAQHRHILPFIATLQTETYTVLISKFMEKGNMAQYLKANPGAKKEPLILEVSEAVDHLHSSLELVHGNLKCQNVLLSDDGHALLTDFGLTATAGDAVDPTIAAIRSSMTLRFAAPEILLGTDTSQSGILRSETTQTDVYAFGMLIIQAFTGTHPWPNVPDVRIYLSASNKSQYPRPAKSLEIGLTDPWWQLCETCLKYEPKERPSMGAICSSIRTILAIGEERTNDNQVTADEVSAMPPGPLVVDSIDDPVAPVPTNHSPTSPQLRTAPDQSDPNITCVIANIVEYLGLDIDTVIYSPNQSQFASGRGQRTTLDVFRSTEDRGWGPHLCAVLRSDGVRHLDNELKVAASVTARTIGRMDERDWTSTLTELSQHPMLDPGPRDAGRQEAYTLDRRYWMARTNDYFTVAKEVQAWVTKLIVDPDMVNRPAEFDLEAAAHIVRAAVIAIKEVRALVPMSDTRTKKLLHVTLLRYPDVDAPFVKVYRIELNAEYHSRVVVGRVLDKGIISGAFNVRSFIPRTAVIKEMRSSSLRVAISEAENLYLAPKK